MARLVLLQGGEARAFDLDRSETMLGRHPECDIQLDSNMVSRKHARVVREGSRHFLEDLGSGNGTAINGQRVVSRALLHHEDRIKLGPILLRFEDPQAVRRTTREPAIVPADSWVGTARAAFNLQLADSRNDLSTVTGVLENTGRFGALEVRPEAKLKAVLEISRSLAGLVDLEALLPRILDTLFVIFPYADRGCILLKDDATGQMVPRAIKHRREDNDESVKLSRTILNRVLEERTGILSADAANDARFNAAESISNFTIRSMMCVPMLGLDGGPMGVINLDTQNPLQQFKTDDLDLLMAIAGQAALSYESARLLVTFVEKQKQDNEMTIARRVQQALLPESLPEIEGYRFFAAYEAAQAVGGDYYDWVRVDSSRLCLAFGDVAGKGVPASLVMSRLASVVRTTLEFVPDLAAAADRINNHMCLSAIDGRFATLVLVMLDLTTHEMSLVNAGHMAPLVRCGDGAVEDFGTEVVGLPVGVAEEFPYQVVKRALAPGETVLIYTDGVSEAMNPDNELYGIRRLRETLRKVPPDASLLASTVLADVKTHARGRPQNDDITLMAFGRT